MYRIPTSGRFSSSSDESLIARLSQNSLQESSSLSSFQTQVDQMVSHFSRDLASPQSCIPLVAGGLAYRLGRVSFLAAGSQSLSRIPLQMFSVGFGFASEIMAYETSHRIIETISHPEHASGLWDWSGSRGWAQGLAQSALTFSILKGVGHQVQGQNILIQHTAQSTAMVAGHQVAAALHLIPNPQGTLIQQLLDAERTNLQLGLSMALVHRLAPSLLSLERQLDLILRSHSRNSILFHPQLFEAMPAYALESSGPTTTRESLRAPLENYVFMANVAISEPPSSPTSSTRPVGEFLSARPTGRTSFPPRRPSRPGFEAVRPPSDISRLQALKDEFDGFDFGTVEDSSVQNLSIDREAHLRWIELNNKGQRSEVLPLGEVDEFFSVLRMMSTLERESFVRSVLENHSQAEFLSSLTRLAESRPQEVVLQATYQMMSMLWRTPGYKIETIQSSILRLLNVSETHPERSQDWRSASVEIEQAGHLLDSEFREKALEIENRLLETGSHYSILDRLFSELDPNLTSKQRHFYRQNLNMTVAVMGTASWRHLSSERIFLESLYLARMFLSSGDPVRAEYILRQGISAVKSDTREANRLRDYMRQRQQSIFQFMNQVAVLDSTSLLWLQEQYEIKDPAEYPSVTVVIRNLRERLLYPSSRMTEEDSMRMLDALRSLVERRVVEPLRDFIRAEGRLSRENASFLNHFAQQSVEVIASARAFDSSNDSLRIADLGNLLLAAGHYCLAYEMMRRFYEIGYGDPMAYMNFLVSAVTQIEILQHEGISELQEQELSRVQNRLMRWQQEFYY